MSSRHPSIVRRVAALIAAPALVGSALAAVSVIAPSTAAPAQAALGECPPGFLPGPGNDNPVWTDNNVAVYAGGDFLADGAAAESEGLNVIVGSATYDKDGGVFNIGTVGVGSAVSPTPGSVMLAVGQQLTVGSTTRLEVGAGAVDADGALQGGSVSVGAAASPAYPDPARYSLNNGTMLTGLGAAALTPWAGFGATMLSESQRFLTLPTTGTATVSGTRIDIAGDGVATQQVFTVDAAALDGTREFYFTGIPAAAGTTVIINVTGDAPVDLDATYVADDGVRADDLASGLFGRLSQRTMWNFADATDVSFSGSGQFLGSVLGPKADYDITASMNGRVYAGGDIHMFGGGNELHNYPWEDAPFDCIPDVPQAGSITLQKLLAPGDEDLLPTDDEGRLPKFSGQIYCRLQPGGVGIETWTVRPPATVTIDNLPVGATCVINEDLDGVTQDIGGTDDVPLDAEWNAPVWTVNGVPTPEPVTFVVPAPGDEQQVAISVTNSLERGAFEIVKDVADASGLGFVDSFSGTWTCTLNGVQVAAGEWTATTDTPYSVDDVPVGAVCTITETPPATVEGGTWTSEISPAEGVTITDGAATTPVVVTVTNTLSAQLGSFTIEKVLDAGASGFDGTFDIAYTCDDDGPSGVVSLAPGRISDPISAEVGSTCTIAEPVLPPAPDGYSWGEPTVSPGSVTITEAAAEEPIAVTVTNTLTATAPQTGSFTITKKVVNPSQIDYTDAFSGTVTCTYNSATATYPWKVATGVTSVPMTVPVGSTCVVSEATPSAPTGGAWGTPQISPASFTVTAAGTTIAVTVTNTLRSELPATGGSVPWWAIALGGGLVLVGAVSLIVASRRRKTGA